MKKLLIILILLTGARAQAQEVFIDSTITDTTAYGRVVIEAGMRFPIGNLADKISPSAEFGAWWRTRIAHNDMLDAGFSLYIPQNPQEFKYTFRGEAYPTEAVGVSGMVGLRLCKVYGLGGGRVKKSVEWVSSFGYAFFVYYDEYKDRNPGLGIEPVAPEEDDKNTITLFSDTYARGLSTFHIGQGLRLNVGRLSFYAAYNFAPYGLLSNNVPDNFGSHSVSVAVQVRI
jgi:hypothetical protein